MPTPTLARAKFRSKDGKLEEFEVHFNPVSLDYTITNTLEPSKKGRPAQHVSESTGKLTMELVFDTTDTGEDVRVYTEKVAKLMQPAPGKKGKQAPPVVVFSWGTYSFEGLLESFKEKIDFFSIDGVPLRATVGLTMSRQDKVFDNTSSPTGAADETVEFPLASAGTMEDIAGRAGAPGAAAAIAAANQQESLKSTGASGQFESLRAPGAAIVRLGASASLGPPVAFAGAGFGLSVGASFGLSVGASFGAGLNASLGLSAGASLGESFGAAAGLDVDFGATTTAMTMTTGRQPAGSTGTGTPGDLAPTTSTPASPPQFASTGRAPVATSINNNRASSRAGLPAAGTTSTRGSASAGIAASEGAFARLSAPPVRRFPRLDPASVVDTASEPQGTSVGVGYRIGGQMTTSTASLVTADVGQTMRLADRIRFDRDDGGDDR